MKSLSLTIYPPARPPAPPTHIKKPCPGIQLAHLTQDAAKTCIHGIPARIFPRAQNDASTHPLQPATPSWTDLTVYYDAVPLIVCPRRPDVVTTRVQAVQAEAVSQHAAFSRQGAGGGGYQEACDLCRHQGRPYTTSARLSLSSPAAAIGFNAPAGGGASVARPPPPLPSGTLAALSHIARWEGSRGLYQGLDVSLIMAVPATVIYYSVYDEFLEKLEKAGMGTLAAPSTAGATARVIATLVMAPLELLRTRSQSQQAAVVVEEAVGAGAGAARGGRGGAWGAVLADLPLVSVGKDLAKVFRQEGASAMWRGVGTTMWRDVPFSMVYWLGYENLKAGLGCGRSGGEDGEKGGGGRGGGSAQDKSSTDFLLRSLMAGALSGAVASLLTHPFDVVKTQRQVVIKTVDGESRGGVRQLGAA